MGKASILFVVFFTALLIYTKYKEPQQKTKQMSQSLKQTKKQMTKEEKKLKVIRMKVTAYCPCKICCGEFADGKTSTGKNAWETFGVAADPKILGYGTKLVIPEVGIRIVDDTGGAMRKSAQRGICHIDVRFHSHQEAKEFGVKWLDVTILGSAD